MGAYQYRVTVEYIADPHGNKPEQEPLRFEASNHDDIFSIVAKLQNREEFSDDSAKAFGVGLKLFGEVILHNRKTPLFSSFMPHFMEIMRELKK